MLTTITAIAGLIFGLSALLLSLLNIGAIVPSFLWPCWDAIIVRDSKGCDATFGQVYLTNAGRCPIYITAAGVEFDPPNAAWFTLTKKQGEIRGRKLAEEDPPFSLVVDAVGRGANMTRGEQSLLA